MSYNPDGMRRSYGLPWTERAVSYGEVKRLGVVVEVLLPDNPNNYSKTYTECTVLLAYNLMVLKHLPAPTLHFHPDGKIEWLPKPASNVEIRGGVVYAKGKPVTDPSVLDGSWVIVAFVDDIPYIERELPRPFPPYKTYPGLSTGVNFKLTYKEIELTIKDNEVRIKTGSSGKIILESDNIYLTSANASQPFAKGNTLADILASIKDKFNLHKHSVTIGTTTYPSTAPDGTGTPIPGNHQYTYDPNSIKSSKIKGE